MADEFSRIDEVLRRLQHDAAHIEVDNGDDAAVLRMTQRVVLSVDTAVEGTHFKTEWLSFDELGYRAAIVALSDLAAMGASASAMLTSLIAPATFASDHVYAIADGCARAAKAYEAPVVGGNMSRGDTLSLTTTVVGALPDGAPALLRSGARPGDALYVTGDLGSAALGLACLSGEHQSTAARAFVARWKQPTARIAEGIAIRAHASSAIDVSDGLLQDLAHVCSASHVGAVIDVDALPLAAGARELAGDLALDVVDLALSGGEDYELLFTLAADVMPPINATRIGHITHDVGIVLTQSGQSRALPRSVGYRHFE